MKISYLAIGLFGILLVIAAGAGCGSEDAKGRGHSQRHDPIFRRGAFGWKFPSGPAFRATNVAVTVYSNQEGGYAYRDLPPGSYTVSVAAAGFKPVQMEAVDIVPQGIVQLEIALQSRTPVLDELTTSEVLLALPGGEEQKAEAARCLQLPSPAVRHAAETGQGGLAGHNREDARDHPVRSHAV